MPAFSNSFPWPSYYGHFNFFESSMERHNRVSTMERQGDGRYKLTRNDGTAIQIFVCECYSFGVAEYEEVLDNFGKVDAVIISSNWCGYTADVKRHCRDQGVGIFDIKGFMAALNREQLWTYLDEFEERNFREKGWL